MIQRGETGVSIHQKPISSDDILPAEPEPVAWAAEGDDGDGVVVILEMSDEVYRLVKPTLDAWIGQGNLACHVRFDNRR